MGLQTLTEAETNFIHGFVGVLSPGLKTLVNSAFGAAKSG